MSFGKRVESRDCSFERFAVERRVWVWVVVGGEGEEDGDMDAEDEDEDAEGWGWGEEVDGER